MAEEQVQLEEKKSCNCNKIVILFTVISLIFSICALALSIITYTGGSVGGGEGKKVVISKQYDKGKSLQKAQATDKPVLVFFYTDWCGFCQRFVPTFYKISKMPKIKKNLAIAYVNCEKQENHKIMEEYGVQGFPTVYVIDAQGKRTQLDNSTFFVDDAKDVVSKKVLELIGLGE